MNCYICNKHVHKALKSSGISFGYCDEHAHTVQIGVVKFILHHTLAQLNEDKIRYYEAQKGAASIEFNKQKEMLNELFDEDQHTEQGF